MAVSPAVRAPEAAEAAVQVVSHLLPLQGRPADPFEAQTNPGLGEAEEAVEVEAPRLEVGLEALEVYMALAAEFVAQALASVSPSPQLPEMPLTYLCSMAAPLVWAEGHPLRIQQVRQGR
jgi:hypothetical protein